MKRQDSLLSVSAVKGSAILQITVRNNRDT
jgi:hypothetical protein